MRTLFGFLVFSLIVIGCSAHESGHKINLADTGKITKGVTTKGEVVQLFGDPTDRSVAGGQEVWTWSYRRSEKSLTGGTVAMMALGIPGGARSTGEVEHSTLTVEFQGDVVQDFSYREGKQASKSSSY